MKKIGLITVIALFAALVISGCGNSKADPYVSPSGPYMFINGSITDVNVSNTKYEIFIQLLKDGFGVEGAEVKVTPFDASLGTVKPSTVTTDVDGWANYEYFSPANTDRLIGQSVLLSAFYDDGNGSVLFGTMTINFVNPSAGGGTCSSGTCTTGSCTTGTCTTGTCTTGTCPSAP